jgi:hypothetical protein
MSKCALPGCPLSGNSSCSVCWREHYCSSTCQKADWKVHKKICPILKNLSNKLQPYREVVRTVDETLKSKNGSENARILEHLLSFAEYQFGKDLTRIGYRERVDGDRISNWEVEIYVLNNINTLLSSLVSLDNSRSVIDCDNKKFPYLQRSLKILNP